MGVLAETAEGDRAFRAMARESSVSLRSSLQRASKVTWKLRPEILLGPQIPKPMHGVNPRSVLGREWWDKTRRESYRSTAYHCIACGAWKYEAKGRSWLEGHELYEIDYAKGTMRYTETVPLCHYCHAYVHRGRLEALLEQGKITHAKYVAIVQHGDQVLREAGLSLGTSMEYNGQFAEWGKWRMLVGRRRVRPKYKDLEAWLKGHDRDA